MGNHFRRWGFRRPEAGRRWNHHHRRRRHQDLAVPAQNGTRRGCAGSFSYTVWAASVLLAALLMRYAVRGHVPVGFLALPAKRIVTPVHFSSPHRSRLIIPMMFWVRVQSLPYPMVSIILSLSLRRRLSAARHIAVITVHLLSFSTDEQRGAYRALCERKSKNRPLRGGFCFCYPSESYTIFTSIVTPDGRLRLVRASITFAFGERISIRRLWIRISNCSRASL